MLRIRLSGVLHRLIVKRPSGAIQSNENAHQKASLPYGERMNVFSHCGCVVHLNKYNPICVTIDSTTPAPIRYILASSPLMSAFVAKCGSVPSIRATRSFRSSVIVISHSFHFGVGIVYHAPLVAGSYISGTRLISISSIATPNNPLYAHATLALYACISPMIAWTVLPLLRVAFKPEIIPAFYFSRNMLAHYPMSIESHCLSGASCRCGRLEILGQGGRLFQAR